MAYYAHDDNNNRIETLSKEEIYALIDEVIQGGELPSDIQEAFVTKLKSIVDGGTYKVGFCTQAQYNDLVSQGLVEPNAYYFITDDTTEEDFINLIRQVQKNKNDIDTLKGKHLYEHSLTLRFAEENNKDALIFIRFLTNTNETLTVSQIKTLITDVRYSCTGSVRATNDAYAIDNITFNTSLNYYVVQYSHTFTDVEAHFDNDFLIIESNTPRQLL